MDKPKKRLKRENRTEWSERVVAIQRVTKVVKGGKKMSFRAIIVVGNEQGKVGVGVGKAGDVITAVKKGVTDGKKNNSDRWIWLCRDQLVSTAIIKAAGF